MTEQEKVEATSALGAQPKGLELLFDYTKFHIGLYLTLTAAYITVITASIDKKPLVALRSDFLFWAAVILFMIAGLAGGVIASSITQTTARSTRQFLELDIGPWEWKLVHIKARTWTWVEHTSFWIGLIAAVLSIKPQ
jgi:hypothetical protein